MIKCKTCKKLLSDNSSQCVGCGEIDPFYFKELNELGNQYTRKFFANLALWLVLGILVGWSVFAIINSKISSHFLTMFMVAIFVFGFPTWAVMFAARDDATSELKLIRYKIEATAIKSIQLYKDSNPQKYPENERGSHQTDWERLSNIHKIADFKSRANIESHWS